jgi:hypothetical protein
MAQVTKAATSRLAAMLSAPAGLAASLAAIEERENAGLAAARPQQVRVQSIAAELAEKTAGVQYPAFYVSCEKLTNRLREKFRTFSGEARLAVDVRVSHDRLENLGQTLELHVEAVTDVLDSHRGDWGGGIFYGGGYEVAYTAARHGGKNFVQTAKVTFDVNVSIG